METLHHEHRDKGHTELELEFAGSGSVFRTCSRGVSTHVWLSKVPYNWQRELERSHALGTERRSEWKETGGHNMCDRQWIEASEVVSLRTCIVQRECHTI
jgi:hypothetical protein